jgi:Putative auto-transporter adhesin, head GIN domain
LDINGLGKFKFGGSSHATMMEINGQNKFDGEAFTSEELILKVTGIDQKIETTVYEKLDVEISGSNNVIIQGAPKEVKQNVAPSAKLKLK